MILVSIISRLMVGGENVPFNAIQEGGVERAELEREKYDSLQPGMDYTIRYDNGEEDKIKKEDIGLFRVRVLNEEDEEAFKALRNKKPNAVVEDLDNLLDPEEEETGKKKLKGKSKK